MKKKYSVKIRIEDNFTGKNADVYLESDDRGKLALSASNFIEACAILINMSDEDISEVKNMIETKSK